MRSPQYVFRVWLMAAGMFVMIASYQNCSQTNKKDANRMNPHDISNEVSASDN